MNDGGAYDVVWFDLIARLRSWRSKRVYVARLLFRWRRFLAEVASRLLNLLALFLLFLETAITLFVATA